MALREVYQSLVLHLKSSVTKSSPLSPSAQQTLNWLEKRLQSSHESSLADALLPPCASTFEHLTWLLKKVSMGQDVMLLGGPSSTSYRRRLLMSLGDFAFQNKTFYTALTADTGEADLKARREILGGSVVFHEQAPVRAALTGGLLILDGVERAERNVLPTLNNLLENREMNLEDGRLIVSPKRFQQLIQDEGMDLQDLQARRIVSAHKDFRVAATGIAVPPHRSFGRPLDPPLRSRFQGRVVEDPSEWEMGEFLARTEMAGGSETPALTKLLETLHVMRESSSAEASKRGSEEGVRLMFPGSQVPSSVRLLQEETKKGSSRFEAILERSLPWLHTSFPFDATSPEAKERALKRRLLGLSQTSTSASAFSLEEDLREDLVVAKRHVLILGPPGSGKSYLAKRAAETCLPTQTMTVMALHRDVTSRELLMRRGMDPVTGDTVWVPSALIKAATRGGVVVLDGVERLETSCLTSLAQLLEDGCVSLPNGERLDKVHPDFRVIALARYSPSSPKGLSKWLTTPVLSLFSAHWTTGTPSTDLRTRLETMAGDETPAWFVEGLMRFAQPQVDGDASLVLSPRKLERIAVVAGDLFRSNAEELAMETTTRSLQDALMYDFLPPAPKRRVEETLTLAKFFLKKKSPAQADSLELTVTADEIQIGRVACPRLPPKSNPELIPRVEFFDVAAHKRVIRAMLSDWRAGVRNVLLMGNQGVGKNKIVDRTLELLRAEREYVQLHRDSTVASLTLSPELEKGMLRWGDSPLVRAAKHGRVLVIDECDKAPAEVVSVLKSLVEGEMHLADGRRLIREVRTPEDVAIHPDFCVWILANRPGYPFLGNDFLNELSECFSVRIVNNPDEASELALLRAHAPQAMDLDVVAGIFSDLRAACDAGDIAYPFSTREAVSTAKHLQAWPEDGLVEALRNVLSFDELNEDVKRKIERVVTARGVPFTFARSSPGERVQLGKVEPIAPLERRGTR